MPKDGLSHTDRPVSSADLLTLLYKRKWLIALFALLGAALFALWALTRPIVFQAESSFQEKGTQGGVASGMSGFLGMLSGNMGARPDTTIPLMKSNRLLAPLAQKYHLQVVIAEELPRAPLLEKIRNNLTIEWAYLKGLRGPLFADTPAPLVVREAVYTAETPMQLSLRFKDNNTFDIVPSDASQPVAEGHLGEPVQGSGYYLIVDAADRQPLQGRRFSVAFETLDATTKGLADRLVIKPDEKSEKILKLTFSYPDRHMASQLVNAIMEEYQQHLKVEHKNLADAQLAYLEGRRSDSADSLHTLISDYALAVSEDLASSGIMESEKELQRLEEQKAECRRRLMAIDLELYRLQDNNKEDGGYLSSIGASADLPELVQETIANLNDLKQRRDRLALALRKATATSDEHLHEQLKGQIADISLLQAEMVQAARLQNALSDSRPLPPPASLSASSPPLMRMWYGKIYEMDRERRTDSSPALEADWIEQKNHFLIYLDNFQRLSKVHQRLMRERLALQQNPGQELQGVDLITAGNLYLALTTQKNDVQSEIRQNTFVIDQVRDPTFEISALSGFLRDPVGQGIVQHYSSQSMSLKDSNIRTAKELDRIREELAQDRSFLLFHLQQGTQLLRLREDFLEKKILAIQEVMLDLIQQQVSVGERHLEDFKQAHIEQLKQEGVFLNKTVQDINQQMAHLPQKWVAEQVIKHQATINSAIVEEVSKLVETKNISHHLEMVQSSPLDRASPPVQPKRPLVVLFAIIGMFLGAGFSTLWVVCKGLYSGINVSDANLSLAGQYVAGALPSNKGDFEPMEDHKQLATLRRLATYLCQRDDGAADSNRLLLLTGTGVDYSQAFATLLSKKGYKVLHLELSFTNEDKADHLPGLLQVLEGKASNPKVSSGSDFDAITAGGITVHGPELLQSRRFRQLLDELSKQYDWIVAVKRAKPASAEAESLSKGFSRIAVTLSQEKLQDISPYIELAQENKARVAFLLTKK